MSGQGSYRKRLGEELEIETRQPKPELKIKRITNFE